MKNNMFEKGTPVKVILYRGTNNEETKRMLESYKHLLKTSPIIVGDPGIDFDVKLNEIMFEHEDQPAEIEPCVYTIIGKGVII